MCYELTRLRGSSCMLDAIVCNARAWGVPGGCIALVVEPCNDMSEVRSDGDEGVSNGDDGTVVGEGMAGDGMEGEGMAMGQVASHSEQGGDGTVSRG